MQPGTSPPTPSDRGQPRRPRCSRTEPEGLPNTQQHPSRQQGDGPGAPAVSGQLSLLLPHPGHCLAQGDGVTASKGKSPHETHRPGRERCVPLSRGPFPHQRQRGTPPPAPETAPAAPGSPSRPKGPGKPLEIGLPQSTEGKEPSAVNFKSGEVHSEGEERHPRRKES